MAELFATLDVLLGIASRPASLTTEELTTVVAATDDLMALL